MVLDIWVLTTQQWTSWSADLMKTTLQSITTTTNINNIFIKAKFYYNNTYLFLATLIHIVKAQENHKTYSFIIKIQITLIVINKYW